MFCTDSTVPGENNGGGNVTHCFDHRIGIFWSKLKFIILNRPLEYYFKKNEKKIEF